MCFSIFLALCLLSLFGFASCFSFHKPPEDDDEEDYQGWGTPPTPVEKEMNKYHENKNNWEPILAWSHGYGFLLMVFCGLISGSRWNSSGPGSMQDLSLTMWSGKLSPTITVMVMTGETIPVCLLRIAYRVKDGKFTVLEFVLRNCTLTSHSTGGSGGESRLTENNTVILSLLPPFSSQLHFSSIHLRYAVFNVEDGKCERFSLCLTFHVSSKCVAKRRAFGMM